MLTNTSKGNEMKNDDLIEGIQEILILMNADLYSLNSEFETRMISEGNLRFDDTQRNEVLQIVMALLKENKK